jgi:hypothetical protein
MRRGRRNISLRRLAACAFVVAGALCAALLAGSAGAAGSPSFVQQTSGHASSVSALKLTPSANVASGDRFVVVVGVWSNNGATAASVTDSAGNSYVELLHFKASEQTEMSVWSAPITAGGGTRPAITVKPSTAADVGAAVSEYAGVSTVADASVVDQMSHASGTTSGPATVASGATAATTAGNELAVGAYVDSGFGDTLSAGAGYTARSNVSNTPDIELLSEDQVLGSAGATPNATVGTGANTVWLMATVVLKAGTAGPPTAPYAPTNVTATAGNGSATVSWTAAGDGGSPITSYTVTPYIGTTSQTPTTVSPPATSAAISGLTNGTAYTFTVSATNAVNTGPASAPSNSVTPGSQPGGQWSSLMSWPIVAVHSVLLDTGQFIVWDGWEQPEPTQVWNPTTQAFSSAIDAPDSIFCAGTAELPDGRVIVVGGYGGLSTGQTGIVDTNIFDPATSTWTRVANMHYPRWYPDLTELSDGRYVAISGNSSNSSTWADTPEVYDPSTNTWTVLSKVSTSQVHEEEYPFSYLAPNGNVFTIGPSEDKSFFLNVPNQTWTQVGGASGVVNGSSVMYRPGKILYSGGAPSVIKTTSATATTAVIDLTAATPTWTQTAPMNYARVYHTLTMLADGTVLAVGGEQTSDQTNATTGVLTPEIWNPTTQTWTQAAPMAAARNYHSTAVLMPDGRVLVAGSGHDENDTTDQGQYNAQIYSPSYLFNGPRPTITSAPASATYGSSISVATPDAASISAVNLVSLGADTHQIDMDQHFVPLSFTKGSGTLTVQIPSSAAVAPPGNYMLFILNASGVPSIAPFINVAPALTAPSAPSNVVAVPGNGSATVSWNAPANGGSPITSYTVTPYIGSTPQPSTTVLGSPPATSAMITGLTNGVAYTFSVAATNAINTGPASTASNSVIPSATPAPAFVQQIAAHAPDVSSLAVLPNANIAAGDRLVVQVGIWNSSGATASSVTDSAGNTYVELLHYKASDGTEMSVWTAPVTAGGGTRPTITVTPTSVADMGVAALEYSGLSNVADTTVADQMAHASGTTSARATVSSGTTPATSGSGELAVGFYEDSGFGDALTAGSGATLRTNISPTPDMEFLVEDSVTGASGATPASSAGSGANTVWLMATIVFKHG